MVRKMQLAIVWYLSTVTARHTMPTTTTKGRTTYLGVCFLFQISNIQTIPRVRSAQRARTFVILIDTYVFEVFHPNGVFLPQTIASRKWHEPSNL
jgi:hypothetical protein